MARISYAVPQAAGFILYFDCLRAIPAKWLELSYLLKNAAAIAPGPACVPITLPIVV